MRGAQVSLALLVALAGSAGAQGGWNWLGPEYTHTAVIGVDGDGAIFIAGLYMGTLVSEDQGETWTNVVGPGDPGKLVTTPAGTVASTDNWGYGIMVTSNKGESWARVQVHDPYEWVSLLAVQTQTGNLYAGVNDGGGIHLSIDGGYTWQPLSAAPVCTNYWEIEAAGTGYLWIRGDAGFWRSEDAGASWTSLAVPAEVAQPNTPISFSPNGLLFMSGFDETNWEAHLLRSSDLGSTWVELTEGLPVGYGCYNDIVYGTGGTMLLADDCSGVYRSTNMGDSWTLYNDGLAATDVIGLVNGPTGAHYLASVEHGVYRDESDVVAVQGGSRVRRLTLEPSRPNPAREHAEIRFTLPGAGRAALTLHDATGRLMRTLTEGDIEAGSHEVRIDAGGLPSGVYFYRLEAAGERAVQRLTIHR